MATRPASPPAIYLLDTNVASDIIRGSSPATLRRMQQHSVASVAISSVTEAELRYGIARQPEANRLAAAVASFLQHVRAIPWDSAAATRYGTLRVELEAAGTPLGNLDTLIAAHALALNATLVTRDKAFRHVPGLLTEDWAKR